MYVSLFFVCGGMGISVRKAEAVLLPPQGGSDGRDDFAGKETVG